MSRWHHKSPNEVYTADEIADRLQQELPTWTHDAGRLCRTYRTHGWKGTLMVVNTIGHLAEAAWHHPELAVSYAAVAVQLSNHEAQGITRKDFELARQIEDVVMWQPARQADSALQGTPADAPYAYLRYD